MTTIAVISDVHGNVPALEAVLDEIKKSDADLLVSCGDLTWGPEPAHTVEVIKGLALPTIFIRGNADRAVVELAGNRRATNGSLDEWMLEQHSIACLDFLASFEFSRAMEVSGLGQVRFCHGSPRADTELITPGTTAERFEDLTREIHERTLVTGHTHLQFDRWVDGRRSVNAGSVGLPYHLGPPGTAYWALLGPDVQLRQTSYDVTETIRRCQAPFPATDRFMATLLQPPTPDDVIAHAEGMVFSD